jgi:hypothetical protein
MRAESRPGSLTGMSDDQIATAAVSLVISDVEWTPDVAPAVMDRISRDAVAYPEQFDRRPAAMARPAPAAGQRSAKRTVGRLAVFALILMVIVVLVAYAATANAAAATPQDPGADPEDGAGVATLVPTGAIDGTLLPVGSDEPGGLFVVDLGGPIFQVVAEAA